MPTWAVRITGTSNDSSICYTCYSALAAAAADYSSCWGCMPVFSLSPFAWPSLVLAAPPLSTPPPPCQMHHIIPPPPPPLRHWPSHLLSRHV